MNLWDTELLYIVYTGFEGDCKGKSSSWSCWWVREESVLQQIRVPSTSETRVVWEKGQVTSKSSKASSKTERQSR